MNVLQKIVLSIILVLSSFLVKAQYTAIVIDADTGKVLHQVAATHRWFPASLTKVMTLYLTFTALKSGQISLYETAPVSDYAASQPNSKLGLRSGESIVIKDAILAVISRSANDAAVVLAEKVAGTEAQFASRMTAMAQSLNMNGTQFYNATGLPHPRQMTSARDMAMLASHVRTDFKEYFNFFSTPYFNFKGHSLPNINSFLSSYEGALGMKTGFTCGSGYNLIAAAHRNGKNLIGVVMGAMTRGERTALMTSILDDGFALGDFTGHFFPLEELNTDNNSSPPYQLSAHTCRYEDYSTIAKHNHETPHSTNYAATHLGTKAAFNSQSVEIPENNEVRQPEPEKVATIKNWTVILGAFNDKDSAEAFNSDVASKLDELSTVGYPIVVQHQTDGENLWHALWTGMSGMGQASNFCKHLWESDIECSILPAEVIAAKEAPWR